MATSRKQLADAVMSVIGKSSDRQQAARAVAGYLVGERRTKELNALLRDLEERQLAADDRLEVTAETTYPLSDAAKLKIRQLFDAKEVIIHEQINPGLVGGVRVRALDKVADFSVQARLRQLRAGRS